MTNTVKPKIIIIGAGPSGSIASALLVKQGFDVTILLKFRSWFFYLKALIYNEKGVLKGYNIG
jgi:thioredoxin reductase